MDITAKELKKEMRAKGYKLTDYMLRQWVERGLLPPAIRVGGGYKKPPRAVYPPWLVKRIRVICRKRKEGWGLIEIEKFLIKKHLTELTRRLEKRGLQGSLFYMSIASWHGLCWAEINTGTPTLTSPIRYQPAASFVCETYRYSPQEIEKAIDGLEYRVIKNNANACHVGEELLRRLMELANKQALSVADITQIKQRLELILLHFSEREQEFIQKGYEPMPFEWGGFKDLFD